MIQNESDKIINPNDGLRDSMKKKRKFKSCNEDIIHKVPEGHKETVNQKPNDKEQI